MNTKKDGNSALGFSCASGDFGIVEKLLTNGSYLNHPNPEFKKLYFLIVIFQKNLKQFTKIC